MVEQVEDNKKFTDVLLPKNFKPVHYELSLKPDLKKFTFEGKVKIHYKGDKPSDQIVLHSNDLEIFDGCVCQADVSRKLKRVTYSKNSETATLEFEDGVFESGTLCLKFNGTLNDCLKGFYKTEFKIDDETVHAATTQFEATDARRCFPCWDEPAIKSTFSVDLTINPNLIVKGKSYPVLALSNMPEIARIERSKDEVEVTFDKTPIMSTYLLCFIVGPFDHIEGTDGKRKIRVYTVPGKGEQGRFALDVACKSLSYYEDYFGIDYPLPKMDLIAIPDFSSGAMENWGLVTYRETCLLVDGETSTDRRQYVALVVAHELAHQWFGNLVTMEWWTHLWLNEGFATFMEFLCVDHIFPEYSIWSQFVTMDWQRALELDALNNSHPIEVHVSKTSEIDEIFDAISYSKGAAVIRMLYIYIGDDLFRRGMNSYLNKFAYKNALTEELWASLEEVSNKPICKLMSGWTLQKGFPWLSVSASTDGDKVKLVVEQNKFTADGKVSKDEEDITWLIPISAVTASNPTEPTKVHLLEGKRGEIVLEGAGDGWIKLNPGTIGLYRTSYSPDMFKKLYSAFSEKKLPPMDRLGMQNDYFALCQAGKINTVELLNLLKAFKDEDNYTVWNSIDSCMAKLDLLLSNTENVHKFHAFGRDLYSEIFKKVTWSPQAKEEDTIAMTRALVINRLIAFGDEAVIAEAMRKYKDHVANKNLIPADLRGAVYKALSVYGDEQDYKSLFDLYRLVDSPEEKSRACRAIGSTKDVSRLKLATDFALSDEVRNSDKIYVILPMGSANPPVAWQLLQDYKDVLRKIYEKGHLLTYVVKACSQNFTTEERAQEIEMFFKDNVFPGAERSVQQSIETIRLNANWLARDTAAIKAYFSNQ